MGEGLTEGSGHALLLVDLEHGFFLGTERGHNLGGLGRRAYFDVAGVLGGQDFGIDTPLLGDLLSKHIKNYTQMWRQP